MAAAPAVVCLEAADRGSAPAEAAPGVAAAPMLANAKADPRGRFDYGKHKRATVRLEEVAASIGAT